MACPRAVCALGLILLVAAVRSAQAVGCELVRCRDGTTCIEQDDGTVECVPNEEPNPCAAVLCMTPSICVVEDGEAKCEDVEYNPCAATTCPVGFDCIVEDGEGKCVEPPPLGPCASARCPGGTQCVEEDGGAKCVDIELVPTTIAKCNRLCAKGKHCVMKGNRPKCVNIPKVCNLACRKGYKCVFEGKNNMQKKCRSVCSGVKCGRNKHCIVSKAGRAVCVKDRRLF